jgi:hypothetical protein
MSSIFWNENLKCLFELQTLVNSKSDELSMKIRESEACENLLKSHINIFSKNLSNLNNRSLKISEYITSMLTHKLMIDPENSEIYETKNNIDHNYVDFERDFGKLSKAYENGKISLIEANKKISVLQELKKSFDLDFEAILNNLLTQEEESEITFNKLMQECTNKGQEYLKEHSLVINYLTILLTSVMKATGPFISTVS